MPKMFIQLLLVTMLLSLGHGHSSSAVVELSTFDDHMQKHLAVFKKDLHPKNAEDRAIAQKYIEERLETYGYDVEKHYFNTSVLMSWDNEEQVTGCNFIAVSKGKSSRNTILVGAHYDSSSVDENNKALRQNGVGIATLLETAHAFQESIRWQGFVQNFTTIFVAFDINTKEQTPKSPGEPGSKIFIREWLEPKMRTERWVLQGSFILDSISTYNTDEYSQTLPSDFSVVFPDAYKTIDDSKKKGNFLAGVSAAPGASDLLKTYAGHYYHDKMARPYRLQRMDIDLPDTGFGSGSTLEMFDSQASLHFWTASPALPSILLTDTATYRSLPAGEQSTVDSAYVFWNPQRQSFVHHTYTSLSYTLLETQTTYDPEATKSGCAHPAVSALAALAPALLARIFM